MSQPVVINNISSQKTYIKGPTLLDRLNTDAEKRYILYIGCNSAPFCPKLVRYGFSGISFTTFEKALNWMMHKVVNNEDLPFAILCDDEIKGENIFQHLKRLNHNNYLKSIPIILISATAKLRYKKAALKVKVDDYYANNADINDIIHRIEFLNRLRNSFTLDTYIAQAKARKEYTMWLLKRPFDIICSLVALILLLPVFILLAILIKLDSRGPVFYIAKRAGSGYKVFDFYKFRTMADGADKNLENISHLNQYAQDDGDSLFMKFQDDPRVTKLGEFLRKTSLDELPQLINVLKGDMSLVGNRPLPLYEATKLTKDQWAQRFLAPAGITGYWQITKRGKANMSEEERIDLDIAYARRSSFLFDLEIIFKTFPALFQEEDV